MLSKLMKNVKTTLREGSIQQYHCWTDSTTVLFWIEGQGTWSQFVRNRTKAIRDNNFVTWHYVPTKENPSDIGSRGTTPSNLGSLWLNGPQWLKDSNRWPNQPEIKESTETNHERIAPKKDTLLQATEADKPASDVISCMLDKYSSYWKLLRVTTYIKRFCNNCRGKRLTGPLTTEETITAKRTLIIQVQQHEEVKSAVNVEKGDDGMLRYVGRVPGYRPIYLPRDHQFVQLLISYHHRQSLHGGVSSTMASLREKYWIPKLRSKVKSVLHRCNTCKRYRVKPVPSTTKSTLPSFRAELTDPFAVIGVYFAGPILYKHTNKIGKAYIALFTCATIRAVHLKLCPDLSAQEFKRALKEFIARRGCPQVIVSDNGKTFVATSKWLSTLKRDNDL